MMTLRACTDLVRTVVGLLAVLGPHPLSAQDDPAAACRQDFRRSDDDAGRIAALEDMARTLGAADTAPPDIVEALQLGLQCESVAVQVRAIELIAAVDAVEPVGETLRQAAQDYERSLLRICKRSFEGAGKVTPGELIEQKREDIETLESWNQTLRALGRGIDNEEIVAAADARQQLIAAARAALDQLDELRGIRDALLEAASSVRSDAELEALTILLATEGCTDTGQRAASCILASAHPDALPAAARHLRIFERSRDQAERQLRQLERARPRRKPSGYDKDAWLKTERARLARAADRCRARIAALDTWAAAHCRSIKECAQRRGVEVEPPETILPSSRWTAWARKLQ